MVNLMMLLFFAAWALYITLRVRKGVHMLQLNAYRNERFLRWANQNRFRAFPVTSFFALAALIAFWLAPWAGFLIGALIYGLACYFRPKTQEKKKLVYTSRVKRLLVTIGILHVVLVSVSFWISAGEESSLIWTLLLPVLAAIGSYLFILVGNFVNWPIERQINQYYFNDAEKRVQSMPDLEVVGITGSYGKTSTKHVLETVLSARYNVLMTPESYNTKMGVTKTIRTMLKPYHELFIAEMGAKQEHDIEEICELVHHKYGILTAVGEQHLETFKSLSNIQKTKFEIVETLPHEGTAFLNKDDENIMSYEQQNKCRTIYYGIDASDLHYRAMDISYSSRGTAFTILKYDGSTVEVETKLLGRHNIYNILAAVAVASEKGMDLETIARALRTLQPVAHRLELKKSSGNITIVDDSFNSNPVGAGMALEVLGSMPEKKVLVTPGMIELGEKEYELNKALAEKAADVCDYIILVGQKQTAPLQDGLQEKNYPQDQYYVASDLQDALERMQQIATEPSVVLLENDLPDTFNE
ncbi:UDP-N-acetylmuramoyl-tripeptide--D-alanyl-D-alanine ligase [Salsuginibacillus halophilus]|uniref:UDP-N-acetylmuramoyl-tripeptide--D-alanyl-D-alanine ligase n=1 Tax=Salsuginibacillus halophilus TaxID=517424 RepID=A0A2P8H3N1_9BACI|nr:UDP-N-acetylmuramoyl-tripeptide--D-alanyl-D-alanine ligase [Salsuginibacillus halophilus]PSL40827.1 UDP-N-acetylmuramoyl-tripeptide--D-alanyl-D-alanine ligase [Salsuginibacillus halophilus]